MKAKKMMSLLLATSMLASSAVYVNAEETTGEEIVFSIGDWPDEAAEPDKFENWEKTRMNFEEQNPGIKIETDTYAYTADTFMAKAAAGQLPDVITIPLTEAKSIGESGYVRDITDILVELGYWDAYKDTVKEAITAEDGRVYCYQSSGYTFGLLANKSVLEEADLLNEDGTFTAPNTYDELAKMAGQIREKTGKTGLALPTMDNCGGWHFVVIASGNGVQFEEQNEDGSWTASFNTQEAVDTLQYIKDLKWKYDALDANSYIDYVQMFSLVGSGQAGFVLGDPGEGIFDTFTNNGMTEDELLVMAIPEGTAGRYALSGGVIYCFSPDMTDEEVKAAFDFLEYRGWGMSAQEDSYSRTEEYYQTRLDEGKMVLPVCVESVFKDADVVKVKNEVMGKVGNVAYEQIASYVENEDTVVCTEPPVYCQELYAILDGVVQEVITNENADPAQLIADAAADFQMNYLDLE